MRTGILEIKSDSLSYLIEDKYGHNVWTRVRFSSGPLKAPMVEWVYTFDLSSNSQWGVRVRVPLGVQKFYVG